MLVLDEKVPLDLSEYDLDAVAWPAPCHAKHSTENAIDWVKSEEKDSEKVHMGLTMEVLKASPPTLTSVTFP